jgi:hypothetical protein
MTDDPSHPDDVKFIPEFLLLCVLFFLLLTPNATENGVGNSSRPSRGVHNSIWSWLL